MEPHKVGAVMLLVEVLLSDAYVGGQGGVHHLAVVLSDEDLARLTALVAQSKTLAPDGCMFHAPPAIVIDARLVMAVVPVLDDGYDEDGGGGEDLDPPESEDDDHHESHHRGFRKPRVIPEA